MRILHTADWHLNDRLGRIDRSDDLRLAVERVAGYCREHAVEVMIVAGDLFSELARPDALRETIRHWQDVFADFLAGGGTILTLTGNHDNENFCQTLCHAMSLAAPTVGRVGECVPPGRLYLAADPTFLRLKDRAAGFEVQFVMMPYPTPTHYFRGDGPLKYGNPDEKTRLLTRAFEKTLADLRSHPKYDAALPSVLTAHVQVYGTDVGASLFRMAFNEDVVVGSEQFHDGFAYVALGHVHKPQFLGGPHVRYSGSIERMDLGEQHDSKGVVLFDLDAEGRVHNLTTLPLPSTPIYEVTITNPEDDLPRLREQAQAEDTTRDLVNLHIQYTAGRDNLEEVLRELDAIYPRWYARDWKETSQLGPSLAVEGADRSKGFAEIVRDYLTQELQNHPDADRDALMALADDLLKEVEP